VHVRMFAQHVRVLISMIPAQLKGILTGCAHGIHVRMKDIREWLEDTIHGNQ